MQQAIQDGDRLLYSGHLPSFLWHMDDYNRAKPIEGFLLGKMLQMVCAFLHSAICSHQDVMRQAYQLVFTGPNSIYWDDMDGGKGQPSLAKKYGIQRATIESIIYVACLVS